MRTRRSTMLWRTGLILIGTIAFCRCQTADAQSLRWRFAAGNQLDIRIEQSTTVETEVDLVKQTLETNSGLHATWTVQTVDDAGAAQVSMVIQSIRLKVTMPGGEKVVTLQVDTAAPPNEPNEIEADVLANLQAVIGREIKLTITPRGEVSSVELDAATKEALRQAPQSMQIRQLLTEEGLRELFASGSPPLPEADVQPGGNWTVAKEFSNNVGKFRREQTLTWVGSESHENVPQERLDLSATLTMIAPAEVTREVAGEVSADGGEQAKPKIKSQKGTGTIWFDPAQGIITQGTVETSLVTQSPYREKSIEVRIASRVDLNVRRTAGQ